MGVVIGGRHTVVGASTIPTLRRTVALTGAMVIILMRRLTMITIPVLMAGKGRLTALTDRQLPGLLTIRTQARTRRRDKVRVPQPSGAARMFREGTKALPWAITRRLMEPSPAP